MDGMRSVCPEALMHQGLQSHPHLDGVVGCGWIEVSEQILDLNRESRESLERKMVGHGWAAAELSGMDRLCERIQPPGLHWLLTWLWAVGNSVQVGKGGSMETGP